MQFAKKVITGCKKINLNTPTFLRLTSFQKTEDQELPQLVEKALQFILVIKQELTDGKVVIQKANCQKNQQTMLISGRFSDHTLFNLAVALYPASQEPLFKVEVVAKNGMLQYDTSGDNAFTSYDYQLDYLELEAEKVNVSAFLNELDLTATSFGKVVN